MKSEHITEILDCAPHAELSGREQEKIAAHVGECGECRRAFVAARASAQLLKIESESNSSAAAVVPPFFQARVMNAWRRQRQQIGSAAARPMLAFRRWWQASAAPVFAMLATMAILITLTFLAPQSTGTDEAAATATEVSEFNLYSTDAVIFNQKPPRDLTTEQVFEAVYNSRGNPRK